MQPSNIPTPTNPIKRYWPLVVAAIIAALLIGGALVYRSRQGGDAPRTANGDFSVDSVLPAHNSSSGNQTFNAQQLAAFDGRNGTACYVAVNGVVYEIKQGTLWKDGQHTTSGGQAMCGKDLSEAIKQSPHGTSKLEALPKVGTFTNN